MEVLKQVLSDLRDIRGFDVDYYIEQKIKLINEFFNSNGLDSAVIGLSGGVDSSVVYALLMEAQKAPGSPIKRVVGLIMPIKSTGTTGQHLAKEKAIALAEILNVEYRIIDLSSANLAYIKESGFTDHPIHGLLDNWPA